MSEPTALPTVEVEETNGRPRWRPLLDSEAAAPARAAIDDIAAELALDSRAPLGPSLLEGSAGRALFFAYLAEVWPERGFDEFALRHLENAVDQMAESAMHDGLYGGFPGVAWVTEHLQAGLAGHEGDDPNLGIDELLRGYLARTPWPGDYDVISGLAGYGIYGLERMPRTIAADIVTRVVERLRDTAVHTDAGTCWHRKPEFLGVEGRALSPDGCYDLGVAHGVPGVLAVLAGAVATGVARDVAGPLLDGAWRWMMANRLSPDAETTYAYSIPGRPQVPTRSAWCYGDPGVAAAMYAAARRLGNTAWVGDALTIARRAAARPVERCGCVDAGLCHGTAGLALIYTRLWQASGEPVFADAARGWVRETLALRRPGTGIAGFQACNPGVGQGDPARWVDDGSFLTGAEGIGLALLAAISTVEPAWDRVLALSLRGPGQAVARCPTGP
jgi:lantibiotic biosynthesis protein